jgi:hypothetical protein
MSHPIKNTEKGKGKERGEKNGVRFSPVKLNVAVQWFDESFALGQIK